MKDVIAQIEVQDSIVSALTPAERVALTLRMLWSHRKVIASFIACAGVVAVIVSLLIPPRYESATRILQAPPSVTNGAAQMMRPDAGALAGLAGLADTGGNDRFVALLQSRVVADRIIDRFGLMKIYASRYRNGARTALAQHTIIQQDRKSGIITLVFSDRDPKRAAEIARAYVEELDKFNAEMNTSGAHLEREFLEARVKEIENQTREATAQLSQFSMKTGMLDPVQQPQSTVSEALKLESQIISARAELSGLEQIYAPESLKVRTARAKLGELQRQAAAVQGSTTSADTEGKLPSVRNLPKLGATYQELARKVKLLDAVQLSLTQKLEIAKTEEVKQLPAVRVMEPAEVPELRVWPQRTKIVLASGFFGLLAGVLFVLARTKWNLIPGDNALKLLVSDAAQGISDGLHRRKATRLG